VAIGISTDCNAAWTSGAWPACEQGPATVVVVSGVTNVVQVAWAYDGFNALVERAQAAYGMTNRLAAIERLVDETIWDTAGGFASGALGATTPSAWEADPTLLEVAVTQRVVRAQTEVLFWIKSMTATLAPYYADSNLTPETMDDWYAGLPISSTFTNDFSALIDDDCGSRTITDATVSTNYNFRAAWELGRSPPTGLWRAWTNSNYNAEVGIPWNFWRLHPRRLQSGVCTNDMTSALLLYTNSTTALGGPVPDDWPLAVWTIADYGWDNARAAIRALKATTAGMGKFALPGKTGAGQNVLWVRGDLTDNIKLYPLVIPEGDGEYYGWSNGVYTWAQVIDEVELLKEVLTSGLGGTDFTEPYWQAEGGTDCEFQYLGATLERYKLQVTNRAEVAFAAFTNYVAACYSREFATVDFFDSEGVAYLGSVTNGPSTNVVFYAPILPPDDIPDWPPVPSDDYVWTGRFEQQMRGVYRSVRWLYPFALFWWEFAYE